MAPEKRERKKQEREESEQQKARSGNTGAVRGSPSSLLGTPLLSPARVPRALQAFSAEQRLDGTVAAAMSPQALGKAAAAGSCAEIVQDGHVLYQDHPGLPVVPASNMKLLTATALLDKFGPSFRFQTSIMVTHKPTRGVVHGDLYFVGGGDPLLRLRSYAASVPGDTVYTNMTGLVLELKAAGVRQVTGSVVGDASELDSLTTVPGWPARYVEDGDVGALSALGIDDGFATAGGQVPIGAPVPVQSAGVLTNLLRSAHISVQGQPSEGKAPRGAQLFVNIKSAPLGSVLGEVLRESDNTAMELMTKGLGRRERGVGSTAAGLVAVRKVLAADGLPLHGFVNDDGSGLSTSDRVTCALLVAVLERAAPKGCSPTTCRWRGFRGRWPAT